MSQQHFAIREASGAPGYKHRSLSSQEQTCYQGMTLNPVLHAERTAKKCCCDAELCTVQILSGDT